MTRNFNITTLFRVKTLRLLRRSRLFFFFFSSRRRHTRSLCDWSSDVCSSDLLAIDNYLVPHITKTDDRVCNFTSEGSLAHQCVHSFAYCTRLVRPLNLSMS